MHGRTDWDYQNRDRGTKMIEKAVDAQMTIMNAMGQAVEVGTPNGPLVDLYMDLLAEKTQETFQAHQAGYQAMTSHEDIIPHYADLIDGFADTIVICIGGMLAAGVDPNRVMEEVMIKSNMSKIQGAQIREDGKFLKGPHFVAPDIQSIVLENWGIADAA
jgi:predicted HAD superfamily Cof-like phosphohydrolase